MKCEGRVAVVTGAAGAGMGRSIALTLAREGAAVLVDYRTSEAAARAIVDHIESRGGRAMAVQADIFEPEGCRVVVDKRSNVSGGSTSVWSAPAGAGTPSRLQSSIPPPLWKTCITSWRRSTT